MCGQYGSIMKLKKYLLVPLLWAPYCKSVNQICMHVGVHTYFCHGHDEAMKCQNQLVKVKAFEFLEIFFNMQLSFILPNCIIHFYCQTWPTCRCLY